MGKAFTILPNFLGDRVREQLLEHALASESAFKASRVGNGNTSRQDDEYRISRSLDDFGELQESFEQLVLSQVSAFIAELGLPVFAPAAIQSEIIAHNDGDFFRRHIDTFSGTGRSPQGQNRRITLVYYFYREPRAFSGGDLCLYPFPTRSQSAASGENMVRFAIEQDTAIVFSSILPHEVCEVSCPSKHFADSRFSINTWVEDGLVKT